jgi:hypothetical protein
VGAIFIAAIAFAISVAWLLLHATTCNGPGLSGGDTGRDNRGPQQTISGAVVNVEGW